MWPPSPPWRQRTPLAPSVTATKPGNRLEAISSLVEIVDAREVRARRRRPHGSPAEGILSSPGSASRPRRGCKLPGGPMATTAPAGHRVSAGTATSGISLASQSRPSPWRVPVVHVIHSPHHRPDVGEGRLKIRVAPDGPQSTPPSPPMMRSPTASVPRWPASRLSPPRRAMAMAALATAPTDDGFLARPVLPAFGEEVVDGHHEIDHRRAGQHASHRPLQEDNIHGQPAGTRSGTPTARSGLPDRSCRRSGPVSCRQANRSRLLAARMPACSHAFSSTW